jgi:hypothetical protein
MMDYQVTVSDAYIKTERITSGWALTLDLINMIVTR